MQWNQKGFLQFKLRRCFKEYTCSASLAALKCHRKCRSFTEFDREVLLDAMNRSYGIFKGEYYVNVTYNGGGMPQTYHATLEAFALCQRHGIEFWRVD
jgi:hypothetical protein